MKKSMKTVIAVLLSALLLVSLAACGEKQNNTPNNGSDKALKIGVIQYVSHPSLDNCYDGIVQALEESDLVYTLERQIGSDTSSDSDCATYAKNMVAQKYDMIFAIATPAAISAYAATEGTDIPVIFCAVSDPVRAKLVESNETPGGLCTGTSDVLDLDAQVDLIQAIQPNVKSIGVIYTTSEPNSITNLNNFKAICDNRGLTLEAVGVQNDSDIPSAATSVAAKVDCINNFTDNKVVKNLQILLDAANEAGIPIYGSEEEQVKNGCLASVSIDYVALGKTTGQMGIDVLKGDDIAKMSVKTITDAQAIINTEVLEALKLEMPSQYKNVQTVTTGEK